MLLMYGETKVCGDAFSHADLGRATNLLWLALVTPLPSRVRLKPYRSRAS